MLGGFFQDFDSFRFGGFIESLSFVFEFVALALKPRVAIVATVSNAMFSIVRAQTCSISDDGLINGRNKRLHDVNCWRVNLGHVCGFFNKLAGFRVSDIGYFAHE